MTQKIELAKHSHGGFYEAFADYLKKRNAGLIIGRAPLKRSSAEIYSAMANSFDTFCRQAAIPFELVTAEPLRRFARYGAAACIPGRGSRAPVISCERELSLSYSARLLGLIREVLQADTSRRGTALEAAARQLLKSAPYKDAFKPADYGAREILSADEVARVRCAIEREIDTFAERDPGLISREPAENIRLCAAIALQLDCGLASCEVRLLTVYDIPRSLWQRRRPDDKGSRHLFVGESAKTVPRVVRLSPLAKNILQLWVRIRSAEATESEPFDVDQHAGDFVFSWSSGADGWGHRVYTRRIRALLASFGVTLESSRTSVCLRKTYIVHKVEYEKVPKERAMASAGIKRDESLRRHLWVEVDGAHEPGIHGI